MIMIKHQDWDRKVSSAIVTLDITVKTVTIHGLTKTVKAAGFDGTGALVFVCSLRGGREERRNAHQWTDAEQAKIYATLV